ncbi:polyphosphate--glucose phosphotransferase [Changpingibacter yushuensis]|uniref:polyphosphate--glucose phosphotransferase n=1 Tax=Changpingibacter yushuensis TaxID=2758440 RepID=UPI00165DE4FD|nr:ROK family protein [Changpingibacter yushuensis]
MTEYACGIDIGGSGVKGGVVDLSTGELVSDVASVRTPVPSTPASVTAACGEVLEILGVSADTPVGITFPAPIKKGIIPFIANLDESWVGVNIAELMSKQLGRSVVVINDADAAALGEVYFGAARGVPGEVIVTTLGTGIGSGVIVDGRLIPNVELGHLEIDGFDAETRASARVKTAENLSWEQFAQRLQRYYSFVEMLFSPDLFVVGGGVSENHEKFMPLLNLRTPIIPASLQNKAGIVGGACAATGRM